MGEVNMKKTKTGNDHSFFKNIVNAITSKQSGGEKSIQDFFESLAACRVNVAIDNHAGLNMEEDTK
jgi:hypothetical protein